jgi:hypothetical protein
VLTLGKFTEMAASYGADLERWPAELRGEAQQLLCASAAARAVLAAEQELDAALKQASLRADATRAPAGGIDAALTRLRTRVAVQLAASSGGHVSPAVWLRRIHALNISRWRWLAFATLGCVATLSGLVLGALYPWPAPSQDLVSMLQVSSLSLWGE